MLDDGIKSSRCYFGLLLPDRTADICLALVPPAVARDDHGCHGGNAFLFSVRMDVPQAVQAVEAVGQYQGFVVQQSYGRA